MTHSQRRRSRRDRGREVIAVADQPPPPSVPETPKPDEAPKPDPVAEGPVKPEPDKGLICPQCGGRDFFTGTVRKAPGRRIWRRRECRDCGRLVSTYEQMTHK